MGAPHSILSRNRSEVISSMSAAPAPPIVESTSSTVQSVSKGQSWLWRLVPAFFALSRPSESTFDQRWSEVQLAAQSFQISWRAHWPPPKFGNSCKVMRYWLEFIYLPLLSQPQALAKLVKSELACLKGDAELREFHAISLLCAPATCIHGLSARLPIDALTSLVRKQPLAKVEEFSLDRWIEDIDHYRGVIDSQVIHLALKWFAKKCEPEIDQQIPKELTWAISWGHLEKELFERKLISLARGEIYTRSEFKRMFRKGNRKTADQSSALYPRDLLGVELCFFCADQDSEHHLLAARNSPYFLLQALASLPQLAQFAALPEVASFDPLARWIALCSFQKRFEVHDRPLDALAHLLKELRRADLCPNSKIWPLEMDESGNLRWILPVPLIPFSFERIWQMMRALVGDGPRLHWLMKRSGVYECPEGLACRFAVRSALDADRSIFAKRAWPVEWSRVFLSGVEQLFYRIYYCRKALVQIMSDRQMDQSHEILGKFDDAVLLAHAESGFGIALRETLSSDLIAIWQQYNLLPTSHMQIDLPRADAQNLIF